MDSEKALRVDDIFVSLQGESSSVGYPTTFIRLFGCNLKCSYCDQPQDIKNSKLMTLNEIKWKVAELEIGRVCITGGEPLMQTCWIDLAVLLGRSYSVSIETNGCCPIPKWEFPFRPCFVMDVKTPSSGMSEHNIYENMLNLNMADEVKFVIADEGDLKYSLDYLERFKKDFPSYVIPPKIVFSPVIGDYFKESDRAWARTISEYLIENKMDYVCLQVQFHKVIGVK